MNKNDVGWKGVFVVSVTPFTETGEINTDDFERCIDFYLGSGIHGLIVGGHASESWALETEELELLARIAIKKIDGRIPVIVAIEKVIEKEIIEIANACSASGADGIMVQPPNIISSATDEEIVNRYEEISNGIKVPMMLYNNPRRTQILLTASLINRLSKIDKIVAIKETHKSFNHLTELIHLCGNKLSIFVVIGEHVFPGLLIGADGYMSPGAVELLGKKGVELYECVVNSDINRAKELHFKLASICNAITTLGTMPVAMKEAMNLLGVPAGYPRRPVLPLNENKKRILIETLKKLGLL